MLKIDNIHFAYDATKFHFNLSLDEGSCLALIGPSGGGKTTLLNLIAGFEVAKAGSIKFGEHILDMRPPHKRPLTMLFQDNNLFAHLSVFKNVGLGLHPGLKLSTDQKGQIEAALKDVNLENMASRLPHELSGGQRQRVALARVLVRDRPLLLLDEPFNALDPGLRKAMLELTQDLRKQHNFTMLLTSHDPIEIGVIADQMAYLEDGKIAAIGKPNDILDVTKTPIITKYLGRGV